MNKYHIFVINVSDQRWEKYAGDERFTRWKGVNGKQDLSIEFCNDKYHYYWNANDNHRKSVAGCTESHLACLKHIYDNKIHDAIIIEDDAVVNFDQLDFCPLDRISPNDILYIGGMFHPPILKNLKTFIPPVIDCEEGFRKVINIEPDKFLITNAHGIYIPKPDLALIMMQKKGKKRRVIDVEYKNLQKAGQMKKFLYPALVTLHLEDAKDGFTWSKYKLKDDLEYY